MMRAYGTRITVAARLAKAFTIIELLVVIAIIALIVGLLVPPLSKARHAARKTKNSSQIKQCLQSMQVYGATNGGYFPGLASDGSLVTAGVPERLELLLASDNALANVLVAPVDTNITPWQSGSVTLDHYSYALLDLTTQARRSVWGLCDQCRVTVIADRNTAIDPDKPESIWVVKGAGRWEGSVGWSDGSVDLAMTHLLGQEFPQGQKVADDNIFREDPASNTLLIRE